MLSMALVREGGGGAEFINTRVYLSIFILAVKLITTNKSGIKKMKQELRIFQNSVGPWLSQFFY